MNHEIVLVSACLIGVNCRHDGGHAYCPEVIDDLFNRHFLPVCPEQLGGLPTPRIPASLEGGDGRDVWQGIARVINKRGEDVTGAFLKGPRKFCASPKQPKQERPFLKTTAHPAGARPSTGRKA